MSRPREPMPPSRNPESPQKGSRKPLPKELARDAIAHEEEAPGGKVRMTFRVLLTRQHAEALAARAIQEEKNLETLVTEILEATARAGRS
jgi:hypothetical protein